MSNSSHMGVLGPTGNKGNPYTGHDLGDGTIHVVGGTGPTGPIGPTGATGPAGPVGPSGGTGLGFGYCGAFSVTPAGQTFDGFEGITGDYRYYQYIEVTGATALKNTLAFYMGSNLRPGSDDLQTPKFSYVPDLNNPAIDNGIDASILGAKGITGTTGPIQIVTLGSGESIVSHITTHATGQHVYFKKFDNAGSDVEFGAGNLGITLGTLFIAGISANAADAIDMGLTGELLYITSDGFADGATGTFFRSLDGHIVSGQDENVGVSYGDTLTAKLINHKEVIRRHGNQRGATAFPVGWSSNKIEDVDLSLGDGNIQKIYCGPTMGYINLPKPGIGDGHSSLNLASLAGNTYDHIIPLTIILHNAASHGLFTGLLTSDQSRKFQQASGREVTNLGNPEGPKAPWEIFRGIDDDVQVDWSSKEDVNFSDRIDIFNFIYSPRTTAGSDNDGDNKHVWYALNPSSNYGITFEGLEYERGACCSESYESGCSDYITREECSKLEDGTFNPSKTCELASCATSLLEGACCTMHTCIQSTQEDCDAFKGFFIPDAFCGTFDCNDYPCEEPIPPTGPCCISTSTSDGVICKECIYVDSVVCDCLDGYFAGVDGICSDCENSEDGQPLCPDEGSCCIPPGGCIPSGCYETTAPFCSDQSGNFYEGKNCCVSEQPAEGRWLTCWMDAEGERNCVLADTKEESMADLPELPEGCANTILWTCGPNESWPECQIACYSQYGPEPGDHEVSCLQTICQECPYANEFPCEIPPEGLGCCCINGEKHPFYTPDFCDLVGGDYTPGNCADTTCTNQPRQGSARSLNCVDCEPRGACCLGGVCDDNDGFGYTQTECEQTGGVYQGAYTTCDDPNIDCCVYLTGSCCIQGVCNDSFTPAQCSDTGGIFQGIGTSCSTGIVCCSDEDDGGNTTPRGACCCTSTDPFCSCEYITYQQCVNKQLGGCGVCEWYEEQGCSEPGDPNCTGGEDSGGDDQNEPTCVGGWHLFVDTEDGVYLGSNMPAGGGPTELPWRTTSINLDAYIDDYTYRPYLPHGADGYWNTHGVWRVPSRMLDEIDRDQTGTDYDYGIHCGMCGSRPYGSGRESQRVFHKDGPFNIVNLQHRSYCTIALPTTSFRPLYPKYNYNYAGAFYEPPSHFSMTGYVLDREASYEKTEITPDGKVITPGFGTGFAYWPVSETNTNTWDIFNVAALSYDSTGGYSSGVCKSTDADADHRIGFGTDYTHENLCNIEPYVMSIDELGFVHKQQSLGRISAGLNGIYWSSSVPTGNYWQHDAAFTYNTSGPTIEQEDIFTPRKFRLAARWMDMTGQNGDNRIPLISEELIIGTTYRIGEDLQSQGHGRDMIYVGRFCPGVTTVYTNRQGTNHDGGNASTTIESEPLRNGKCCTALNENNQWPFSENIYTCLSKQLLPPQAGSSANTTGWPIVNRNDGKLETGSRRTGDIVYSWSHRNGNEPAWIAFETQVESISLGGVPQTTGGTMTKVFDPFEVMMWGYIESDGANHGNPNLSLDGQSEIKPIGCMGLYGTCNHMSAARSLAELTTPQGGTIPTECEVFEDVNEINSGNFLFGGAHIGAGAREQQSDFGAPGSLPGTQDPYHLCNGVDYWALAMGGGCQTTGRCCWLSNNAPSGLPNCVSACDLTDNPNETPENKWGGSLTPHQILRHESVYTQKTVCENSGGVWTSCVGGADDGVQTACTEDNVSGLRSGNCYGEELFGACCVTTSTGPECVLNNYTDPNNPDGSNPCPGTYYGDGSQSCINPPCGGVQPCSEDSDCAANEYCCDNDADGTSYCQGSPCAKGGDFNDDNCCDDNDDGINDYWCLNCPKNSEGELVCPGATDHSGGYSPDLGGLVNSGCGGLLDVTNARRSATYGKILVNDPSTIMDIQFHTGNINFTSYQIQPFDSSWVAQSRSDRICRPLYAGEDPNDGTNWMSPGCPCEPYLTQQDCYLSEFANCSPGCCHWDIDVYRDSTGTAPGIGFNCATSGPDFELRGCSATPNLTDDYAGSPAEEYWMAPDKLNRHDFARGFQYGITDAGGGCNHGSSNLGGCKFDLNFMLQNYSFVNYPMSQMIPSNNWSGTIERESSHFGSIYARSGYPRTVGGNPETDSELIQLLSPSEIRSTAVQFPNAGNTPNQTTAINRMTKHLPGPLEIVNGYGAGFYLTSEEGLFGWDPIDNLHYSTWVHSANVRTEGLHANETKTAWGNLRLGDIGSDTGAGVGGWYYLGSGYGEAGVDKNNHFGWRGANQGDEPSGTGNAWWKVGNETRFIYGKSVNGPSYWCPPYAGLQLPPSNPESWWLGSSPDGVGSTSLIQPYGFELPDQSGADFPVGMSPCYSRRFKINFESYSIDDRFQAIQTPWPKGARTTLQAYDRLKCYYNCVQKGLCINPETDTFADQVLRTKLQDLPEAFNGGGPDNRHLWLNGVQVIRGGLDSNGDPIDSNTISSIEISDCAEKCLGYPASPEWVLYDSLCVDQTGNLAGGKHGSEFNNTIHPFNSSQKHGTIITAEQGGGEAGSFVQKCVHYTYPQCPLRLDYEQINNGFNYGIPGYDTKDGTSSDATVPIIEKRLREGYGPGGQGPIPPIMVGFANCNSAENGGSVWKAKISECSGWENSMTGQNNSSGGVTPSPPAEPCGGGGGGGGTDISGVPIVDQKGDRVPIVPDETCDNGNMCDDRSTDQEGNKRGTCHCPQCGANGFTATLPASLQECSCRWYCINEGCFSAACLDCVVRLGQGPWYQETTQFSDCSSCASFQDSHLCHGGCSNPANSDNYGSCYFVPASPTTADPFDDASGAISDCHKVYAPTESSLPTSSGAFNEGAKFTSGQYYDSIYGDETECQSCIACIGEAEGCWPGPIDKMRAGGFPNQEYWDPNFRWDGLECPEGTGNCYTGDQDENMWGGLAMLSTDNASQGFNCLPAGFYDLFYVGEDSDYGYNNGNGLNILPAAPPPIGYSSDLVGLLCGWNSEVHTIAKSLNGSESSAKVVLNVTTCPMLFLGVHPSQADHQACEQHFGYWRCLCAQDQPQLAGSSLGWQGTGAGESTACKADTADGDFGCPRGLGFKRLFMQYGKHPSGKFTLMECSQGRYDSVYLTGGPGGFGAEPYYSNGWRDSPQTYENSNGFTPDQVFLLWPWLKNHSIDGNGIGIQEDDFGIISPPVWDLTQALPHQYINGIPFTENISPLGNEEGTSRRFRLPCAGSGYGDPENNGICLRRQSRAPEEAKELCCNNDPSYCPDGAGGCITT